VQMENDLIGIGRMAALSGLSVSALRFYDGAGILVPASVDPANGYRGYAPSQLGAARIVAHLRRVGMPLSELAQVLESPSSAADVLDAYLQRLQDGLADARREISIVRSLLEPVEHQMSSLTVPARDLFDALTDVRFAVSADPELPMLGGVLLDYLASSELLRVVATDRYRLATSAISVSPTDDSLSLLIPVTVVDELLQSLGDGTVTLSVSGDRATFGLPGNAIQAQLLPHEFPDYQRLLPAAGSGDVVTIASSELRQAMTSGPVREMMRDGSPYEVSVLAIDPAGTVTVADGAAGGLAVGVNREFLLQALAAGRDEQLLLELDGPIGPLAIRNPARADSYSILMPVRLE
jgi:DNA polymerase-3 subunit beta